MSLDPDIDWILWVCKGDRDAADFLYKFFAVCHLWDDLIDKDVDVRPDEDINRAFWVAFIDIPNNPYYRENFFRVNPVMAVAITEWFTANKLEAEDRKDIAYTLRCSIVSLIHQAAGICGGYDWAVKIGPEIRMKTQDESFDDYLDKLKCQPSPPQD